MSNKKKKYKYKGDADKNDLSDDDYYSLLFHPTTRREKSKIGGLALILFCSAFFFVQVCVLSGGL